MPGRLLVAAAFVICVCAVSHAQSRAIEGVVLDSRGGPIAAAEVSAGNGSGSIETSLDGSFTFQIDGADVSTLTVRAPGFREAIVPVTGTFKVNIVLEAALPSEAVTVTAERAPVPVSDSPASVRVLTPDDLSATSAQSIDGALRQIPGFQLFRRTDSRYANPTTQGAAMRGVAASAASRAAVLVDGVPADDPFGGWVQWGRFPRASIDRAEATRGASSMLYGSQALGGVVELSTPRPSSAPSIFVEASGGRFDSGEVTATASAGWDRWSARISGEAYRTDGYVVVPEDERGIVDTAVASTHSAFDVTLQRTFAETGRAFVRGSIFGEERANGTPLQTNGTVVRTLAAGVDWRSAALGAFTIRAYGGDQVYDQSFSAIGFDRSREDLTRIQRVPSQQTGGSITWTRLLGERHLVVAGYDVRNIRGASDEIGYFGGNATSATGSGGRQAYQGGFGSAVLALTSRIQFSIGGRFDRWSNTDALSSFRGLGGSTASNVTRFDDRTETAFSPRAGLLVRVTPSVALFGSAYRGFRAPTLNELYRSFRVGNVVTLANEDLLAERLTGGEGGASFTGAGGRFTVRGAGFWSVITRPVANVTLAATPEVITRRRENLGRTRARGLEVDCHALIGNRVTLGGGYTFTDATVLQFPANTVLEGLRIPQVPRHTGSVQARFDLPSEISFAVQARFASEQFDDDLNMLPLKAFGVVDVFATGSLGWGIEAFVAAENLFDTEVETGRTPVTTLGPPVTVRVGLRLRATGR